MRLRTGYLIVWFMMAVMITVPYIFAGISGGSEAVFGGFLLNPIDGNSYLAKMRQGFSGDWLFRLPYTPDPGEGEPLFLFYLFLGHLGKWLGLDLLLTFHLARVAGAGFMLWALFVFWNHTYQDSWKRFLAYTFSALGSGMGWLGLLWGQFAIDFWVAEAYPFLSAYSSPHFGIGLALMLLMLSPGLIKNPWIGAVLSICLGIIQPFGLVVALIVRFVQEVLTFWRSGNIRIQDIVGKPSFRVISAAGAAGGTLLLYQYWIINRHPVLQQWQIQNQTPTPPVLDILLGLSPWIFLAGLPFFLGVDGRGERQLLTWAATAAVLVIIPWELQRRFFTGLLIPLIGLGAAGVWAASRTLRVRKRILLTAAILLTLPTNLIVLFSGVHAAVRKDPQIFLLRQDRAALRWLERNGEPDALVLANRRMGLYVPAYTGLEVIYGHPFETADADFWEDVVSAIYSGSAEQAEVKSLLLDKDVDYILVSGRDSQAVKNILEPLGRVQYSFSDALVLETVIAKE